MAGSLFEQMRLHRLLPWISTAVLSSTWI